MALAKHLANAALDEDKLVAAVMQEVPPSSWFFCSFSNDVEYPFGSPLLTSAPTRGGGVAFSPDRPMWYLPPLEVGSIVIWPSPLVLADLNSLLAGSAKPASKKVNADLPGRQIDDVT